MRFQVAAKGGTIIADLGDYGAAVDISIRHDRGWMSARLPMRSAKKLAEALVKMATKEKQ